MTRLWQKILFALSAFFCWSLAPASRAEAPQIIILFSADNFGHGDLDQERIELSSINQLLQQGTRFNNFYSSSPYRHSAFYSVYTGLHTGQHPIRSLDDPTRTSKVFANNLSLELKKLGYQTAFSGLWPFTQDKSNFKSSDFSFETFNGLETQTKLSQRFPQEMYINNTLVTLGNPPIPLYQTLSPQDDPDNPSLYKRFTGSDYSPEIIHKNTLSLLKKHIDNKSKLFLHYAHLGLGHGIQAPEKQVNEFQGKIPDLPYAGQKGYTPNHRPRATQLALYKELNKHLADLITQLENAELMDKTLFIFTSLNGVSELGGRELAYFNSKNNLRGSQGDLFEGGLKSPLLVRWPALFKNEAINNDLISQASIYQNVLSIAKDEKKPVFLPSSELYWETKNYRALRKGTQKFIEKKSLLTPSFTQLFDLSKDPEEKTELSSEQAEVIKELKALADLRHKPSGTPSPFDIAPKEETQ